MRQKSDQIENKVKSLHKYEQFLEQVRERNPDEYHELSDILNRYRTLKDSNEKLQSNQQKINEELDKVGNMINTHTKEMRTKIMTLNNDIAFKQKELEVGARALTRAEHRGAQGQPAG